MAQDNKEFNPMNPPRIRPLSEVNRLASVRVTDVQTTSDLLQASAEYSEMFTSSLANTKSSGGTVPTRRLPGLDVPFFTFSGEEPTLRDWAAMGGVVLSLLHEGDTPANLQSGFLTLLAMYSTETIAPAMLKAYGGFGYTAVEHKVADADELMQQVYVEDETLKTAFEDTYDASLAADVEQAAVIIKEAHNTLKILPAATMDSGFIPALGCIMFCLMAKRLTPDSYETWKQKRWDALMGAMGLTHTMGLSSDCIPPLSCCVTIHSAYSSNTIFRSKIFKIIYGHVREEGRWGKMAVVLMKLVRGAEMNHFQLINEWILCHNPVLIYYAPIQAEIKKLHAALRRIRRDFAPSEWAYLKLLRPEAETEFLNRNNFLILTAIAAKIGREVEPTLEQYMGGMVPTKASAIVDKAVEFSKMFKEKAESGSTAVSNVIEGATLEAANLHKMVGALHQQNKD